MKAKIISSVLVISLLWYVGCYSTDKVVKDGPVVKAGVVDISVLLNDQRQYSFAARMYQLTGDSLFGYGVQKIPGYSSGIPFRGSLPLSDIMLVETKEFSAGKTIVLVGGVGLAVAGIIALANSKDDPPPRPQTTGRLSCPFIYTFDGTEYQFESETFAGAVFKGVERTAYDALHYLKPINGTCRLKLVNAREETEYINELKLIAVDHPTGTIVIPDRSGTMHTVSTPIQPTRCVDFRENNILGAVADNDGVYWQSDLAGRDWTDKRDLRDGIVMEFPKPLNAKSMKLVVKGKNTRLGYFALAKIFQMKGNDKLAWYGKLEADPAERAKFARWLMREGMLHIHLWQDDMWVEKAALPDVGSGIAKDQIAVLDITGVGGDVLKVRLDCTTDLWRIDQVYVDYSPSLPLQVAELPFTRATNEKGVDVSQLLSVNDAQYYVTVNDQHADIEFADAPRQLQMNRTYIAKTRGFYYQWLNAEGQAEDALVERILTEPLFGTKMLMPQWIEERKQYEGISESR